MNSTVPKSGYLDAAGQIFLRQDGHGSLALEGRTPVEPMLAQLFWVLTPDLYLVFQSLAAGVDFFFITQRLLQEELPLVWLEAGSVGWEKIVHLGKGNEADAAKATTLVKVVCGWDIDTEIFEISSDTKTYQVKARLDDDTKIWCAWIV